MFFDLIRALLAAFFVGVAPGWFWASFLAPATDRAERLAYAICLSLVLVPSVTLVPARLFGLGVTLPVAVLSALLVFAAGLAVRLRFGPRKGDDAPVAFPPAPLGPPTLVLLVVALGLALLAALGRLPVGQVAQPILVLLFFAAVVHLVESWRAFRRGDRSEVSEPAEASRWAGVARRVALPVVLALVLVRGYSGPVLHDWPFIRGVDHYSHAVMAGLMMDVGTYEGYLIYPPGFHTTTAMISRLSGLSPLEIFPVLAPSLLALPPLALYALARRLWGWEVGVAAALLVGLCVNGTYAFFNDAMYPNLVASQLFVVLSVAALAGLLAQPSVRSGLLLAVLGSGVVLFHPLASLYLVLILAAVGLLFVPYLLLRDRRRGVILFLSLALLFALAVLQAWDTYDLSETVTSLVSGDSGESATGTAVGGAIGTQDPYDLKHVLGTVSRPVAVLGILGVLLLPTVALRRSSGSGRSAMRAPYVLAGLVLIWWSLILFAGSRTTLSGFPQRFERDLGVPLALLAALALVAILRSVWPVGSGLGTRGPVVVGLASVVVVLAGALIWQQADRNMVGSARPTPRVVVTPEIAAAGEWLRENNEGGNIMVSPHINQVPSRIMLAYGGYTALQSFELTQIEYARDLPPQGPEPMLDVLSVINNPDDEERSRELLERHDVRYVVLYKSFPDRDVRQYWWRSFKEHPDLYRTAFENSDVVVFEPHESTS